MKPGLAILALLLPLTACGRPDASGVYLAKAERRLTLIQLVQARDGAVTGRVETVSIGPDGLVSDESRPLDGAAAGRDLAFSSSGVTLGALTAQRSSLKDYQAALKALQSRAVAQRRGLAEAEGEQADLAAKAATLGDGPDRTARLDAAAAALRGDAEKLGAGVDAAPDFAQRSAQNTTRMEKLAATAGHDRGQALASASQLIVDTNQAAVARARYVAPLNQIIRRSAPLASEVQNVCGSDRAQALSAPCAGAAAAATGFQSALVRAVALFSGQKRAIQDDLARQNAMLQKMGG